MSTSPLSMSACAMQMATTSSTSTLASVSMMRGTPADLRQTGKWNWQTFLFAR